MKTTLKKASKGVIVKMNGNQPVQKTPGSKGVKSGVNPKASAQKVAKGRVGGTSTAPKAAMPKKEMGGPAEGRSISENAAARKVAKGKGMISKPYPSGPEEKGSYVGYGKEGKKSSGPFISMKGAKAPRPIRKKGGMVKK